MRAGIEQAVTREQRPVYRSARTLACRLGTLAETFGIKYWRQRSKQGEGHWMVNVTAFADLPSAVMTRCTVPAPPRLAGSGPKLIWSSPS
jgi:hypothetical protein